MPEQKRERVKSSTTDSKTVPPRRPRRPIRDRRLKMPSTNAASTKATRMPTATTTGLTPATVLLFTKPSASAPKKGPTIPSARQISRQAAQAAFPLRNRIGCICHNERRRSINQGESLHHIGEH